MKASVYTETRIPLTNNTALKWMNMFLFQRLYITQISQQQRNTQNYSRYKNQFNHNGKLVVFFHRVFLERCKNILKVSSVVLLLNANQHINLSSKTLLYCN